MQAREMPEASALCTGSALGELKWSNTMASSSKGGSSRTTSKFGFDVTKPVKRGFLNKQGKTVQRFRNRFFVLYPGFLVYYDEETKWRRDYTRGDTLEVFFESRARVFMVLCVNIYIYVLQWDFEWSQKDANLCQHVCYCSQCSAKAFTWSAALFCPQSRLGAIKLKGGRCSIPQPHGVSKECKFPFVLHAPDPINKREWVGN